MPWLYLAQEQALELNSPGSSPVLANLAPAFLSSQGHGIDKASFGGKPGASPPRERRDIYPLLILVIVTSLLPHWMCPRERTAVAQEAFSGLELPAPCFFFG